MLLPGHKPSHAAKASPSRQRFRSVPISDKMTRTPTMLRPGTKVRSTPKMLVNCERISLGSGLPPLLGLRLAFLAAAALLDFLPLTWSALAQVAGAATPLPLLSVEGRVPWGAGALGGEPSLGGRGAGGISASKAMIFSSSAANCSWKNV